MLLIAGLIGFAGLILLFTSALLGVIAAFLYFRKPPRPSQRPPPVPQIVPEPFMPQEISAEVASSTNDHELPEPDDIATEVLVRSVPPTSFESEDSLPGTLLAETTRNKK